MALVSMCISLMQEQLVQKTRWLLTEVGIIEEDIDPMQKYKASIIVLVIVECSIAICWSTGYENRYDSS